MKRKASAIWNGGLKDGQGTISTESGVLKDTQYSFSTRFENGVGTNPEELVAAAHAGCFSMALSAQLGGANLKPDRSHHNRHGHDGKTRSWVDAYGGSSGCDGENSRRNPGRV